MPIQRFPNLTQQIETDPLAVKLANVENAISTSTTNVPTSAILKVTKENLESSIATKSPQTTTYTKDEVDTIASGKASSNHTHAQNGVTNLVTDLAGKEPTITGGTSAQYLKGDKTLGTLDKTAVGLANVDNTTDAGKPVSTATQTALDLKLNISNAGGMPTFTAGESITTGDLVELRTDAKIYKAVAETLGSWVTAGGMNSDNFKYAMKTGTDEFMAFGCGGSIDYYAIGGTIASNGVITLGSAISVTFTNRSFTGVNLIWHPIHNKFFAFCTDNSANYMVTPLTLASNVTTKGTSQSIIASASVSFINIHYSVANQRAIFVYTDPLNTSYLSCCSYTINADGTSVAGTKLVIASVNYGGDFTSIWDDTFSTLLVYYSNSVANNSFAYFTWSAGVFTSKGSQSFAYTIRDYNGAVLTLAPVLFKYDNNRNYFLILTNSFNVYTKLISISYDTTLDNIAIGGIEYLDIWRQNSYNTDVICNPTIYDQTTNMLYGISYQNATFTDCILYGYKLSANGKFVRTLRRVIYPYASGSTSGYALSVGTNGKILIGAIYGSNIVTRCIIPNTIATKFLGVSQETKTINNACKVALAGSISAVHSGLTVGSNQFISEANVIGTTQSEKPLGYSLSATSIQITRNAY